MSGPERLRDSGSRAERLLLDAADRDGLSPDAKKRIAAALLTGAAIGAGTSAALGLTARAATKLRFLLGTKWLLSAIIAAGLAVGAEQIASRHDSKAPALISMKGPSAPAPEASEASMVAPEPTSSVSDPIVEAPHAAPSSQATATPSPKASSLDGATSGPKPSPSSEPSLADEVAALETVRAALAQHDASGALASLTRYERDFPKRSLGLEASTLRIEALLEHGDRAAALALAKRILQKDHTYETRLHSLFPELTTP